MIPLFITKHIIYKLLKSPKRKEIYIYYKHIYSYMFIQLKLVMRISGKNLYVKNASNNKGRIAYKIYE